MGPSVVARKIDRIAELCRTEGAGAGPIRIMEICGTHTVSIARSGLRKLLPERVRLISGPGCPVCVTDGSYVDQAMRLARGECGPAPIIATYGDMVRVPGTLGSLAQARAAGASVVVVTSADHAVELARKELANPSEHASPPGFAKATPGEQNGEAWHRGPREVVFLGVGFETTTPGTALAVLRARQEGVKNFSVLTAHKVIMPAMRALLQDPEIAIDGFLCPGHVSVILGYAVYEEVVVNYHKPCVVAGFEPAGILEAIAEIIRQIVEDRPAACTVYPAVTKGGNAAARRIMEQVFVPCDAAWRALGVISGSGLALRPELSAFDAKLKFAVPELPAQDDPRCRCGLVITGRCLPRDCPLFGKACTPREPVGPCMVSSEGACAASYKYERA